MKISQLPRYAVSIDGETALIGTAAELSIALDVLNGSQDRSVLEQLRPHLPDILHAPRDFVRLMRTLQPDNQTYLIDAMGSRLTETLTKAQHLRDLLAAIASAEVKRHLIDALGASGLRALVATALELASILAWTYGSCGQHVVDLLGPERVRHLIRHGEDLSFVLNALAEPSKLTLIEIIGPADAAKLVLNGRDLALLLRAMPRAAVAPLLGCFTREKLIDVIGRKADWAYLFERIEPAEATQLIEKLGADPRAL